MTTYIIYADPNDGYLQSISSNYYTARSGTGTTTVHTTDRYIKTGQNRASNGTYYVYESFYSFDTSVITDTEEIVDATFSVFNGWTSTRHGEHWGQRFFLKNWTAPLTTSQWQNPSVEPGDLVANYEFRTATTPYQRRYAGSDELVAAINKTGLVKMVSLSGPTIRSAGTVPTEIWVESSNTTNGPQLVVYTTTLSTMNVVGNAVKTLSDGTTVSVRSNGAANPTLTVGYQPPMGSWTSLGTLNGSFNKTIDGQNTLAIAADSDDNFYIVGISASNSHAVVGQAYVKNGTYWTSKNALIQLAPQGNASAIRSITADYMGGSSVSDKPSIRTILGRGTTENLIATGYADGAGWAQDTALNAENLKAGTGLLFRTAANALWANKGYELMGIPAYVDSILLTPNLSAIYTARGKIGNRELGGLYTMVTDDARAMSITKSNDPWVPTGASKLVAINSSKFAHIYDQEGKYLLIAFFNADAQYLGSNLIGAQEFHGGTIDHKWTAHYDPISDLVRVFYVNATGGGRALTRVDVSTTTFASLTVPNVTTTMGPVGSVNTILRASTNADERRVVIESSNVLNGVLSTQAYYSTAGNIPPTAPDISTKGNFDASVYTTFNWRFSDRNPKDVQSAYQLEISRVSDSFVIHDTGIVASGSQSYVLQANTLANGVDYRWRVRTYDSLGAAGTYSAYQSFSTSAVGSTSITTPSIDNQLGYDTSSILVQWNYSGAQRSYRVVVTRTATNTVSYDSGTVTSTVSNHQVTDLLSGVEYRIEVFIINSAGLNVPVASRLVTSSYAEPMTPSADLTVYEAYIEILVVNPPPTGDRPEVFYNDIYRRESYRLATDADFVRIGTANNNGTYRDFTVKSEQAYDYKIVSRSN